VSGTTSRRWHGRARLRAALAGAVLLLPAVAAMRPVRAAETRAMNARANERTTWDSVFTLVQAERGQAAYAKECARCHAAGLEGADAAPALAGSAFQGAWNGQILEELHARIHTAMPTDTPGVYSKQLVTDVVAHLLRANGFPAGAQELTHENGALLGIRFVATRPGARTRAAQGARVPSTR